MDRRRFLVGAAALPAALRASPDAAARRLGGTPVALVTADTESRIVAVELATGRRYRAVPMLPGPRSVEAAAGTVAVVAHTAYGAVSLLDAATLRVRHVLQDFAQPRYTAATPEGRYAYVTDSARGDVSAVDVLRGRILGRAALGGPARHVSIDPRGRRLWVSLGSKAAEVALVDVSRPAQPRLVRRIRPPFLAHDVGFAAGGRHLWLTSGDRGSLAVYDAWSGDLLRRLPAGAPPQHVTFLERTAYVTSGDDGTLRVHSLRNGDVLGTTRIPVGSYNVQRGWGVVLTPSLERGTLCVLDGAGRLRRRVDVAASSHDACFVMTR